MRSGSVFAPAAFDSASSAYGLSLSSGLCKLLRIQLGLWVLASATLSTELWAQDEAPAATGAASRGGSDEDLDAPPVAPPSGQPTVAPSTPNADTEPSGNSGPVEPPPVNNTRAGAAPVQGADPQGLRHQATPPASARPVYASYDQVGGHLQIAASASVALPFGQLSTQRPAWDALGVGFAPSLELAYGISRHVAVGASATLALHGDTSSCASCDSTLIGGQVFVRYHLVQGLRFDPWVGYGLGFTQVSQQDPKADRSYTSIDWMNIQFGGDFSLSRQFGFGPTLNLSGGSVIVKPDGEKTNEPWFRFMAGLRIVYDLPGR